MLKSIKRKALLARGLSRTDWLVLAGVWWELFGFNLALRWMSYDRLDKSTRVISKKTTEPQFDLAMAQRLHRLIVIASHYHLLRMTCLMQALTFRRRLARRGVPAEVRIGANKLHGGIQAHAWVEVEGKPVGEFEDITERFNVLR